VICGQFMGLSLKVQCIDLDSFSLNPQSLYHAESMSRWVWILLDASRGSWWRARMALSSAKSPVMVRLVVGWSDVYRLNKRRAATAPCGTPALIDDMSDKALYRTEKCRSSR
jgi:hypothetical protein